MSIGSIDGVDSSIIVENPKKIFTLNEEPEEKFFMQCCERVDISIQAENYETVSIDKINNATIWNGITEVEPDHDSDGEVEPEYITTPDEDGDDFIKESGCLGIKNKSLGLYNLLFQPFWHEA